jgi:hypothetical protein
MTETLTQRLDRMCAEHRLEWLVLPCEADEGGTASRAAWRHGPYWCALLTPGPHRSGHGCFYAFNGPVRSRENDPPPQVVYIHPGPLGRHQAKRLLLTQLEQPPSVSGSGCWRLG